MSNAARPKDLPPATGVACDLAALRQQIDAIDDQILALINRRMDLARGIGGCKRQNGTPVHDPRREQQVLDRLAALNPGPLRHEDLTRIFAAVMAAARALQHKVEVQVEVEGK